MARLDVHLAATGDTNGIMATIAVCTLSGEPVTRLQPNAFSAVLVRGTGPLDAAAVPTATSPVGNHPVRILVNPQGMAGFYNFVMFNPFNPEGFFENEKVIHIQLRVTSGPDQGSAAYAVTIVAV